MSAPMLGTQMLSILQASQTSLHGDLYFDLLVQQAGAVDAEPYALRVAQHACVVPPTPGRTVKVEFLMGQVQALSDA